MSDKKVTPAMNVYKKFYRDILYPFYHRIKNDGVIEAEKQAFLMATKSPEQMAAHQTEKLTKLLRFCFKHVPFYRDALSCAGIKSVTDIDSRTLKNLPLLSKPLFTENFNQLIADQLEGNTLFDNSTSGSSGQPFKFKTDLRSLAARTAVATRCNLWADFERGDKEVMLWGAQIDASKVSSWRGKLHSIITRRLFLSSYSMSDNDLAIYVNLIRDYQPTTIVSYPGPLYALAAYYAKHQHAVPRLKSIITSAEMLFDYQRHFIEKIFHVRIFNRYGSREFGCIAHEDRDHDGLRVNTDRVFIEILRQDGSACDADEVGDLYITDLDNYGMPLIRYRIGDRAAWPIDQTFYPGMPFPRITEIEGRAFDLVIAPNGNRVGGTFWTILMRSRGNIQLFQIVQRTLDSLLVNYQADDVLQAGDESYFRQKIVEKCGEQMQVHFEKVPSFEVPSNGKHRIVISLPAEAHT